jgi:hypothetical protein
MTPKGKIDRGYDGNAASAPTGTDFGFWTQSRREPLNGTREDSAVVTGRFL